MRSDLPVTKLAENVYLLNEFDGTNCLSSAAKRLC